MDTVSERLEDIFRDIFNDDDIVLSDEMTASSIPGWDSLAHVNLMFSIEEEFGVRFDDGEFAELTTVGDLRRRLSQSDA